MLRRWMGGIIVFATAPVLIKDMIRSWIIEKYIVNSSKQPA
jgi:hypothetical protein